MRCPTSRELESVGTGTLEAFARQQGQPFCRDVAEVDQRALPAFRAGFRERHATRFQQAAGKGLHRA
jgi:hypothetical protein